MPKRKVTESQLKALEENRHKGQFCGDSAVIAAKKKHEKEKIYRPLKEIVAECLDEESVRQIMAALMQKAMEGDVRAWETLRDSSGQKPKDEVLVGTEKDLEVNIKVID